MPNLAPILSALMPPVSSVLSQPHPSPRQQAGRQAGQPARRPLQPRSCWPCCSLCSALPARLESQSLFRKLSLALPQVMLVGESCIQTAPPRCELARDGPPAHSLFSAQSPAYNGLGA